MKRLHLIKLILPVTAAFGIAAVTLADHSLVPVSDKSSAATDNSVASPTPSPNVTVNGKSVHLPAAGSTTVPLPSGQAEVSTSGGQTTVTTKNSSGNSTSVVSGDNSLNISVDASSSGGTSTSSTQVFSSGSSSDAGSSFTSNSHVFSSNSTR